MNCLNKARIFLESQSSKLINSSLLISHSISFGLVSFDITVLFVDPNKSTLHSNVFTKLLCMILFPIYKYENS